MAILMDGKALAAKMRLQIKEKVEALTAAGTEPALAVIIVGNNPASRFYVNNKKKDCAECGIRSIEKAMPEETTEEEVSEEEAPEEDDEPEFYIEPDAEGDRAPAPGYSEEENRF